MSYLAIIEQFAAKKAEAMVEAAIAHEQPEVGAKVQELRAAGVPWLTIAQVMLPFVLQLLSGQPVNWNALISALAALLVNPPNPAPSPSAS